MIVEDLLKQAKPRAFIVSFNQAVERPKREKCCQPNLRARTGEGEREAGKQEGSTIASE